MGDESTRPNLLTEYTEGIIQMKARQLARRCDFQRSDGEDLAQEMRSHLLRRAPRYDPARGSINTFVAHVLNSWIASLLRSRRRLKRAAGRKTVSLDAPRGSGEGADTALRDALSTENIPGRSDALPDDVISRKELMTAVARVVDALPPLLREICQRLPDQPAAAIQRELGLSRRKFDTAMTHIRQTFAAARLGISADTSAQNGVRNKRSPRGPDRMEDGE
ncbi:MAG: sigma factor [Phycisphaerae bacterium]|nr:sigma factor [Phycisphaerae bacterium]